MLSVGVGITFGWTLSPCRPLPLLHLQGLQYQKLPAHLWNLQKKEAVAFECGSGSQVSHVTTTMERTTEAAESSSSSGSHIACTTTTTESTTVTTEIQVDNTTTNTDTEEKAPPPKKLKAKLIPVTPEMTQYQCFWHGSERSFR